MNNIISHQSFAAAFPNQNDYSQHQAPDSKVYTLSHQLFSLKKLAKQNPDEIAFYQGIAKQIFIEKHQTLDRRGKWDRFISAIGNFFMGRGCHSSDYLLKKVLQAHKYPFTVTSQQKPFFKLTPKKFVNRVADSEAYTDEEKTNLVKSTNVYSQDNKPVHRKTLLYDSTIINYLNGLSVKNPTFRIIPAFDTQNTQSDFEDKFLKNELDDIVAGLPKNLDGPTLFAHPIRLNGNHHTTLVIDIENGSVEYYNSFGSDSRVKKNLLELEKKLSIQYEKPFTYRHATKNTCLQKDSYQCGVWTCKFVEERIKQGPSFDPSQCNNDVSQYRKHVYSTVYKFDFYNRVGMDRFNKLQENLIPNYNNLRSRTDGLFHNLYLTPMDTALEGNYLPLYYEWCKTGNVPDKLLTLLQETIANAEDAQI